MGKKNVADKYHKGSVRSFIDAKNLNVIDRRVTSLVEVMNCPGLISTVGSCEGHGFPFVKVPPYVSFKSSADIASALEKHIKRRCIIPNRKLHYCWCITTSIDDNFQPTYVLEIPGLSEGSLRFVMRSRLDRDFKLIGSVIQEILDHFNSKDIEMKRQKNQANNTCSD